MPTIRPTYPLVFEAVGFDSGLAGSGIWIRVINAANGVVYPPSDDPDYPHSLEGITERVAGSGFYGVTISAPDGGWPDGKYTGLFDDGGTPIPDTTEYEVRAGYTPPAPGGFIPSLEEIGAHLDARTLAGDERQHTFNEDTTPTGDQVLMFVDDAVGIVQSAIGVEFPEAVWPAAKYAVICRVAMAVERSEYAPETDESDGAYQRWLGEYQVALASLSTAIDQNQPGKPRFGSLPIGSVTAQSLVWP